MILPIKIATGTSHTNQAAECQNFLPKMAEVNAEITQKMKK